MMTQASKDSCMNMLASVQRCKEVKKAKHVAQIKQDKHINIAWSVERVFVKQTDTTEVCLISGNIQTIHKRD